MNQKNSDLKAAVVFLMPSVLGFSIFFFLPFIWGIYYSLVDSPVNGRFVGLTNYINLLKNPIFLRAIFNTFAFTIYSVPIIVILSLLLAMLLNRNLPGRGMFRTAFISPLVVPVASIVLVWQIIFDSTGIINGLLSRIGIQGLDWMNTGWARFVVVIVYIWKNIGYNVVLFLAGLQAIPVQYYQSADIDGAGVFRKFISITFVYLTPTTFFVFIISIINSFKVFRETYLIAGEYPHNSIYMLQHYMNNTFRSLDYQKLTSAAVMMAIVIYFLVLILFITERRISRSIS